jgi:glucose/arabinose dehydrogenase
LTLTLVSNQLNEVILAISAPDDPDRVYVVQKSGEIMIIENGQLLPTPFLDISNLVNDTSPFGEEGLLGLAFHPDYATNGRFFVHYSKAGNGDNVVQEFKRSASDPHVADPTPVAIALEHPTAESNHNGGSVMFGPDGFLYLSMGDGGNQGDPECDAQKTTGGEVPGEPENLLGKISRLDVDAPISASGYPAAAGNPSGHKAYHVGFRNPWRISFDACTGDLYVGDVGQSSYEEVSVIPSAMGPINGGWPYREGAHDYNTPGTCPAAPPNPVEPILDYTHGGGRCAVMGGYVYRSAMIPALRGTYFYGDYCSGDIYMKQPGQPEEMTSMNVAGLSAFGQDGHGNVYACSTNGSLFRIDAQ